jgi:hypothetical protein
MADWVRVRDLEVEDEDEDESHVRGLMSCHS